MAFLDEDNWYNTQHLELLFGQLQKDNAQWGFSLRNIYTEEGEFVCKDLCESLGSLSHTVISESDYLVDTSCYLLERELAITSAKFWNIPFRSRSHQGKQADREVYKFLQKEHPEHTALTEFTVNYTTGNTGLSVTKDFFLEGNKRLGLQLPEKHDTIIVETTVQKKPKLYVYHFTPEATHSCFQVMKGSSPNVHAYDEWQPTKKW